MKTMIYGMGLLILTILVTALAVWFIIRFSRRFLMSLIRTRELLKSWDPSQKIEIRLICDVYQDVFDVQVRKKRWRLFKTKGWKYVNQYVKGDPILDTGEETDPDLCWKRISYKVGFNQFAEEELLKSMIKTYGDLDGYYLLRADQYRKDKKSFKTKDMMKSLNRKNKDEETYFTPVAGGGLECL